MGFDSAIAKSRGGMPTAWAKMCKFKAFLFCNYNAYTMLGANYVCREYCRRAQYFYDIWFESEAGLHHIYSKGELQGYEMSFDFVDCMRGLGYESEAFEKGMLVRRLPPTSP